MVRRVNRFQDAQMPNQQVRDFAGASQESVVSVALLIFINSNPICCEKSLTTLTTIEVIAARGQAVPLSCFESDSHGEKSE